MKYKWRVGDKFHLPCEVAEVYDSGAVRVQIGGNHAPWVFDTCCLAGAINIEPAPMELGVGQVWRSPDSFASAKILVCDDGWIGYEYSLGGYRSKHLSTARKFRELYPDRG